MSWKIVKLEKLRRELDGYNRIFVAMFGSPEVTEMQLSLLSPMMRGQMRNLLRARTEARQERAKLER